MSESHNKEDIKEDVKQVSQKVEKEFKWYGEGYLAFIIGLILIIALGAFSLNGFLEITDELRRENLEEFDERVTSYIYQYRGETMTEFVTVITDLGDEVTYAIIIIAVVMWFLIYKKNARWLLQSVIILASTAALNVFIKHMISRERPEVGMRLIEASSYSYPSGHSMVALAFYGFLIYLAYVKVNHRWIKILAFILLPLLIIAIGASRVYLGVHYPSDVVAGFAAGLFWLVFVIFMINAFRLYRRRKRHRQQRIAMEDTEADD
ncbi:MAG: phosphatase PAP2 family protein [Candidatus Cyclobacteriaceae bacterium M2_1C_046]